MTATDRREEYRYDAAGRLTERLVFGRQERLGNEKEENGNGDAGKTVAGRTVAGRIDAGRTNAGTIGLGSIGNEIYSIHMDEQTFEGSIEKSLAGSFSHAEMGNTGMQGAVCPTELALSASYHYSYDRQGNTLSDGENQYRYDSRNRLTEIETQNGDLQRNRYDGEGLRAELEENGELTRFLYSGRDVVAEQDGKNNTVRYVRGLELLSSDSECARTYYHYAGDELGSIAHVTDENGTVLNRYAYDAFGNWTVKEETVPNRFGFTGEICDGLTGQYYLRARFYNPVIGRFLNEDTYYGDGLNLYSYCRNNPVRYVDPSGYSCEGKEGRRVSEGRGGALESAPSVINTVNDLSQEQIDALIKYSGDDYVNINKSLRGLEMPTLENQVTINTMKSALDNASLPENMTLYRGTSTEALGNLKNLSPEELVGKQIIESGFMSTSTSSAVANGTFSGNMQVKIEASSGVRALDISSISQYSNEAEILFNAGQKMTIISAENKSGILYITVLAK